jgi:UDP-N-acetylmuramoyl-tripeptide--D-alanyl-D-alanine ligase
MSSFRLTDLLEPLNARQVGPDTEFRFISIDSRTINPGDAFIAIKGPQFDGHDFVSVAAAEGASVAIVQRQMEVAIPQLIVSSTDCALSTLARLKRNKLSIPILSVTGSCGKTTTKSMMASILSHCGFVHAGKKSFNNHYGVPLTLLGIDEQQHQYAVVEMGANHQGEIAHLTEITRPHIAVITLAAPVHLEGFRSIQGVAEGKGEIFQGLIEEGIAIINEDDVFADYWKTRVPDKTVVTFGFTPKADFRAVAVEVDAQQQPRFILETPIGSISIKLPLMGEHNILNALAASAATAMAGADLNAIQQGLESMIPVDKRLVKRIGRLGVEILDDSYNANPTGVEAALRVLANKDKEKILVLGEMAELGAMAVTYHQQLGKQALRYGISKIYAMGDLTQHTVSIFGEGATYFSDQSSLIEQLLSELTPDMCILVKGSFCNRLDHVVDALLNDHER